MIAEMTNSRVIAAIFLVGVGYFAGPAARGDALDDFAAAAGLRHAGEFHRTVTMLRHRDGLPRDLYVTKREARDLGWQPGDDICPALGGRMIGGDRFDNRERALPDANTYHEADLDEEDCGRRGPKRLIFDANGDVWITPDHYRSFERVP